MSLSVLRRIYHTLIHGNTNLNVFHCFICVSAHKHRTSLLHTQTYFITTIRINQSSVKALLSQHLSVAKSIALAPNMNLTSFFKFFSAKDITISSTICEPINRNDRRTLIVKTKQRNFCNPKTPTLFSEIIITF